MDDPPVGYTSTVHTSLLEPVLFLKQVPYWPGIVNVLIGILITVTYQWWSFPLFTAIAHLVMALLTKGDHRRLHKLVRLLRYPRYLGTKR